MLRLTSSDSVRTASLDRAEVFRELSKISATIRREHVEVGSLRLFGSLARGDHLGTSDIDVLVILRCAEAGDRLEWVRELYRYFSLQVGVDLLVYTEREVAAALASGDAQFTRIWADSRSVVVSR